VKVMIAGAGNVGSSIARELIDNGHAVVLVERDPGAIELDAVPGAEWLLADACELNSLEDARLSDCAVAVAATGDDKVNLVVSLLAKTEFGVPRVVARVNHPKNEWLFNESWGVDVSVSTPRLLSALVEEAVSVGDLVRLLSFRHGEANLVEVTLPTDTTLAGRRVGAISWPMDVSLVAILRDARVMVPSPDDPLEVGDELFFVAAPDQEGALHEVLANAADVAGAADTGSASSDEELVARVEDDPTTAAAREASGGPQLPPG
jgi:trk system potassium uptake protein TrkA